MHLEEYNPIGSQSVEDDFAEVDLIVLCNLITRELLINSFSSIASLLGLWRIFGFCCCFFFSLLLVLVPFLSHLGLRYVVLIICICFSRRRLLGPGRWADGQGLSLGLLVIPIYCIQQLRWPLLHMHSHIHTLFTRLGSRLPLSIRILSSPLLDICLLLLRTAYYLYVITIRSSILLSHLCPLFDLRCILQRIQVIRILHLALQLICSFISLLAASSLYHFV